jgi:hypothetical protein
MTTRKEQEAKRMNCDAMLIQFMPVKTIARALAMSRGTISERAKRAGMARHYITNGEMLLLLKRRMGGCEK